MIVIEEVKRLQKEKRVAEAIALLRSHIDSGDVNQEMYLMELGIIYNSIADFSQALNCFNEILHKDPQNTKAQTYVTMINGILNYYCKDLLNP